MYGCNFILQEIFVSSFHSLLSRHSRNLSIRDFDMSLCRPPLGAHFFLSFCTAHLLAGGLLQSQVLPPSWLLWNQLSGVDGRMGKQHE